MFFFFTTHKSYCDAAINWQFGFQDPATPVAEGILRFHHDLMFLLIFIVIFVSWILVRITLLFNKKKNPTPSTVVHGTTIEIIWTLVPAVILIIIAVPSFALLYSVDEVINPSITIKVVGHQWYWSYEFSDYETADGEYINFDSYIIPADDLVKGDLRLLEVDNRIILPIQTHIRLVVTSADVLHCWAVPSFGLKIDACPGRLNEASLFIKREGSFYGQCSEICGINHGFIPICVEAVNIKEYLCWISENLEALLKLKIFLQKMINVSFIQICFFIFVGFLLFGNIPKQIKKSAKNFKYFKGKIQQHMKSFKKGRVT